MIVISPTLVLSEADEPLDTPLIGWRSIVTVLDIAADTEHVSYPITNVANPSTVLKWVAGDATEQYITITVPNNDELDYVGIARHNLGTMGIAVSIEGYTEFVGSPSSPDWFELTSPQVVADNKPLLFRFEPQSLVGLRIRLQAGSGPAFIAVLYAGKLLVMERGVDVGTDFTPLPFGRQRTVVTGRSEAGDFLGRIVTGSLVQSQVQFSFLRPAWYRSDLDPFIEVSDITPFFFAWAPEDYPGEVGYACLTDDPTPQLNPPTGTFSVSLQMQGILE